MNLNPRGSISQVQEYGVSMMRGTICAVLQYIVTYKCLALKEKTYFMFPTMKSVMKACLSQRL